MIIFHCFPTLEDFAENSNFHPINRVYVNPSSVERLASGEVPFLDSCKRVVEELTGLTPADDAGYQAAVRDMDDDLRPLLALVLEAAQPTPNLDPAAFGKNTERIFDFSDELIDADWLRILQTLPLTFHFAITFNTYRDIAECVNDVLYDASEDDEQDYDEVRSGYGFTVIANGHTFRVWQSDPRDDAFYASLPDAGEDEICFQWGAYRDTVREKLLEKLDTMPLPRHDVPLETLDDVDGVDVPVTARLLFAPHSEREQMNGFLSIVCDPTQVEKVGDLLPDGGLAITCHTALTMDDGRVRSKRLSALCQEALALAKENPGSTVYYLVTGAAAEEVQDYRVLDDIVLCITATTEGIYVSDYRHAVEDFAEALKD